jgi:methionyl-tRNA formyltransferase
MGTSSFAVAVLERLAATQHRPALVVSRPDRPRGRGRKLSPPPAALAAGELGIDVFQPDSVNEPEARRRISAAAPEAVCVCAFGALIKDPLLHEHEFLNVHPSLLPRWRGAAPIERAIMAGDELTGVSIIRLTEGLDSGPICAQQREPISAQDSYGTLAPRLAGLGAGLLVSTLDERPPCVEQDDSAATYAEKISSEDRRLDPVRATALELERVVRALTPQTGAWVELEDGTRLGVGEARALPGHAGEPGTLVIRDVPVLACAEGELQLLRVRPPGRREMTGAQWLRGYLR